MLNPNNDRLNYGEILSPPNNYKLDFAIGTTYSLDLDALVGATISLGLSEETDTNLVNNPIFLLNALRAYGNKIILFCEGGQIHLHTKPQKLYILLENMVFQVNNSKTINNQYASFHPKFWLLRYINQENNVLYRVVVLSRNLTFDRSWDITFSMDGFLCQEKTDKNDPIKDFLEYLKNFSTNDEKSTKISEIINELSYVHFDLKSDDFCDFEFIPNGIDEYSIENCPLYKKSFDEILIMSPFLSEKIIKKFNDRVKDNLNAFIFTRESSLNGFKKESCSNFKIYILKDQIIDGESSVSEESEENSKNEIIKQDIHAKMFMVNCGEFTDLYLGSLNATYNALYGNIEFMVRLKAKRDKLNLQVLSEGLFDGEDGGPNSPFQLAEIDENIVPSIDENNELNLIIKIINRFNPKSNITFKDNSYIIELSFENFKKDAIPNINDFEIRIRPFFFDRNSNFDKKIHSEDLAKTIIFENIEKIKLSEFFVVSVNRIKEKNPMVERVIKVSTTGFPEDREKEVISKVLENKESFIRYVAFLLGDNNIFNILEAENLGGDNSFKDTFRMQIPELYEKMLKATVHTPEKFDEIDFLIKTLSGDNAIPEGFEELYTTFKQVVDEYE